MQARKEKQILPQLSYSSYKTLEKSLVLYLKSLSQSTHSVTLKYN